MSVRTRQFLSACLLCLAPLAVHADTSSSTPTTISAPATTSGSASTTSPTTPPSTASTTPPTPSTTTAAPVEASAPTIGAVSSTIAFDTTQLNWNEFDFKAYAPNNPGYLFAWDFDDGGTSAEQEITHSYIKWGTYVVKLTVTDPSGNVSSSTETVRVSFFNLRSPFTLALLGVLALILVFGGVGVLRLLLRPPKRPYSYVPDDDEDQPAK